jgi:hypothetical protein
MWFAHLASPHGASGASYPQPGCRTQQLESSYECKDLPPARRGKQHRRPAQLSSARARAWHPPGSML